MKTIMLSVIFILFLSNAYADLTIVQETEQAHPGGTSKLTTTIKIKGTKVRMDHSPISTSSITDNSTGKGIGLFHFNKTYNETSTSQMKEGLESVKDNLQAMDKIPNERPQLNPTGKKDVINGWKVEEYTAQTKSMKATYWFAKELLRFSLPLQKAMENPMMEDINKQFPDPKQFPGMPVVMTLEQETPVGNIKSTTRVLSIKESPVPESDFSVPPGYKRQ